MPRARGGPARTILLLAVVLTGTVSYFTCYFRPGRSVRPARLSYKAKAGSNSARTPATAEAAVAGGPAEQHFSPAENLEQLDRGRLDAAQHTVDIAMYSFTDSYLAEELLALARRGVRIRLYRDRQQYEEEQQNARERRRPSTTDLLRGQANIHLRVKAGSELMHLKAYLVDGRRLRDGSANWSPTGLKRQDNNAHYTSDPAQVRVFQQQFEQMWNRPDNESVQ
jgi:phosphatidylserine/phosphatidylglycerophosphate/cardiolipin synthase-like enzyme